MRRLRSLLLLCALAGSAQLAAAQDSPPRIVRVVSSSATQQVSFRVQLNRSGALPDQTLQLRSSAAVYQRGDHLDIVTPAEFLITTEAPFQASFSTVSAGEALRLLLPVDTQRIEITGARVVLARDKQGAPVHLQAVEHGDVRSIPQPSSQR